MSLCSELCIPKPQFKCVPLQIQSTFSIKACAHGLCVLQLDGLHLIGP